MDHHPLAGLVSGAPIRISRCRGVRHPIRKYLDQGLHRFLLLMGAFIPRFLPVALRQTVSEPKLLLLLHQPCAEELLSAYRRVLPPRQ